MRRERTTYQQFLIAVLTVVGFVCLMGPKGYAQEVGDDPNPLYYSTHIYSVTKSIPTSTSEWNIFRKGIDTELEADTATAFARGNDYTVEEELIIPNVDSSYIKINFNKAGIQAGDTVSLAYFERTADNCVAYRFLELAIADPLDVDIALSDEQDQCPDMENIAYELAPSQYQTSLTYGIKMHTNYINNGDEEWGFNYEVSISSLGETAKIDSLIFKSSGGVVSKINVNPDASIVQDIWTQSTGDDSISIRVVVNDVLGVDQVVRIDLSGISAEYEENDVDNVDGAEYNLNNMPNAGYITTLN